MLSIFKNERFYLPLLGVLAGLLIMGGYNWTQSYLAQNRASKISQGVIIAQVGSTCSQNRGVAGCTEFQACGGNLDCLVETSQAVLDGLRAAQLAASAPPAPVEPEVQSTEE